AVPRLCTSEGRASLLTEVHLVDLDGRSADLTTAGEWACTHERNGTWSLTIGTAALEGQARLARTARASRTSGVPAPSVDPATTGARVRRASAGSPFIP